MSLDSGGENQRVGQAAFRMDQPDDVTLQPPLTGPDVGAGESSGGYTRSLLFYTRFGFSKYCTRWESACGVYFMFSFGTRDLTVSK